MCPRAKTAEKRSGARKPRERMMVPGVEGTGGAAARRRSFWLAVSGSGRRVAFHEAAGSRHRLRRFLCTSASSSASSSASLSQPPRLPTLSRGEARAGEAFLLDIEGSGETKGGRNRPPRAINLPRARVRFIDNRRWCATPRVPSARRKWTRT